MLDAELSALDAELVQRASSIHVLRQLDWPLGLQQQFLDRWHRGERQLPRVDYAQADVATQRRELERIGKRCEQIGGPVADYLRDTARSYADACRLIALAGKAGAGAIAVELYGRPGSILPGSRRTNLEAAEYFVSVSREVSSGQESTEADYCLPATQVATELRSQISSVITEDEISVVIDPTLASKAAAGATRIRLRDATCFSEDDVAQLVHHEAFVHSLTALNGRKQPRLKSLSLGAPRTTAAQEGLATFAELVTGAIDIARMKRIALRVGAIDRALSGADFVEVFEFFVEAGQSETESFNSAKRVFRGVPLEGGYAFTKDVVYLTGLLQVHTFFRWALGTQQLHLCEALFAGRMTLSDVLALEPAVAAGTIVAPRYLPPWMVRRNGLTAYLAFSVFANEIALAELEPDTFSV